MKYRRCRGYDLVTNARSGVRMLTRPEVNETETKTKTARSIPNSHYREAYETQRHHPNRPRNVLFNRRIQFHTSFSLAHLISLRSRSLAIANV